MSFFGVFNVAYLYLNFKFLLLLFYLYVRLWWNLTVDSMFLFQCRLINIHLILESNIIKRFDLINSDWRSSFFGLLDLSSCYLILNCQRLLISFYSFPCIFTNLNSFFIYQITSFSYSSFTNRNAKKNFNCLNFIIPRDILIKFNNSSWINLYYDF